jgi:hypothetical protein
MEKELKHLLKIVEECKEDTQEQGKRIRELVSRYVGILPYCTQALKKTKGPQRHILVKALVQAEHSAAVEGLVLALNDKEKGIREQAQAGLLRLPSSAVVPALKEPLHARTRAVRLKAAQILSLLPQSPLRDELALERLSREKVAAVRELLEAILPPALPEKTPKKPTLSEKKIEAIVAELKKTKGQAWTKYKQHGADLLNAYWSYLEGTFYKSHLNFSAFEEPCVQWHHLLQELRRSPLALEKALEALPAYWHDGEEYLHFLQETFENLPQALSRFIAEGRYKRPSSLGPSYEFELHECLEWMEENWPGWPAASPRPRPRRP